MNGRPDRMRKARRASRLDCGCWIQVGHAIGRVNGSWRCIECIQRARRILEQLMTEPPQPSERGGEASGPAPDEASPPV